MKKRKKRLLTSCRHHSVKSGAGTSPWRTERKKEKKICPFRALKRKGKRKGKRCNPVPSRSHSPEQTAKTLNGDRRPKKRKKKAPIPSGDADSVFADTLKRQPGKDEEAEKDQKKDMDQKKKEKGKKRLKADFFHGEKSGKKKGEKGDKTEPQKEVQKEAQKETWANEEK